MYFAVLFLSIFDFDRALAASTQSYLGVHFLRTFLYHAFRALRVNVTVVACFKVFCLAFQRYFEVDVDSIRVLEA
jgi:hypothetical protein